MERISLMRSAFNKLFPQPGKVDNANTAKTSVKVNNARIELIVGDITLQEVDAIVNAANRSLRGGAGVDGAIHRVAGPQLGQASSSLAPCETGEVVLTPGFQLKAHWVIHTVGPVFQGGTNGEADALASCYRKSVMLADHSQFSSIAFPAISTGVYGYPVTAATEVAMRTIIAMLPTLKYLELIRFVLYSNHDYSIYSQTLAQILPVSENRDSNVTRH